MIGEDLGDAAENLTRWAENLERKAQKYQDLQGRMAALTITESTSDNRIGVTVDSNGVPTAIHLAASTRGMDPAAVSSAIMSCLRSAQAKLRSNVTALVHEMVGDDGPGAGIIGQYAQRFPDPEPQSPTPLSSAPQAPSHTAPQTPTYPPQTPSYTPQQTPSGWPSAAPPSDAPPRPTSRKPDRDQIVRPDERDEDDAYYNRKSWLI
ncbi:YbaB/EbfC family nucleoid-associated protein [Nocardia sp. bgisy134]|uniref:YbaB/EbfC family nucleoid-associated protein n=1 Tax=unclassified Nocardia TaxID=2637762 RepID=UPI003D73AEAF